MASRNDQVYKGDARNFFSVTSAIFCQRSSKDLSQARAARKTFGWNGLCQNLPKGMSRQWLTYNYGQPLCREKQLCKLVIGKSGDGSQPEVQCRTVSLVLIEPVIFFLKNL